MLRVWGGGIYEDDYFYRRCDELGLMVWQDFMFACAMYPGDEHFLENVRQEALDNVERLRNHPCLALWCGNNENSEAWHHWGWQAPFTPAQREKVWEDYQKLHYEVLKPVVEAHSGGLRFWESSPLYGRAEARSFTHGDAHYWGVWHDGEPFETYAQKVPRFMSEFGFQSFPDPHTIAAFADSSTRTLLSPVMLAHQKHPRGNQLIQRYMDAYLPPAEDFAGFAYRSQLLQAEGICAGIEAHRRARPYCMGTLYWQLNDCWPVASWSGRDFYGRWKALHHRLRDAFAPTLLSATVEKDRLRLHAVHDTLAEEAATLSVEGMDFEGNLFFSEKISVVLQAASAAVVWERPLAEMGVARADQKRTFVRFRLLDAQGRELASRLFFWEKAKFLQLPLQQCMVSVQPAANGAFPVTIGAATLQKGVALEAAVPGRWSDNYFDLAPGESRTLLFTPETPIGYLQQPKLRTLNPEPKGNRPAFGY
jgi:beta-mannosidase